MNKSQQEAIHKEICLLEDQKKRIKMQINKLDCEIESWNNQIQGIDIKIHELKQK